MKRLLITVFVIVCGVSASAEADSQDSLALAQIDFVEFFTDAPTYTWVGQGRFLYNDYSDTLVISSDSSGQGLVIRRVLVRLKDTVVISRGQGSVIPADDDSTLVLTWSDRRMPELTGRIVRNAGEWMISLDGEWSAWSLRIHFDSRDSFLAALSRSLGAFPSMELLAVTYKILVLEDEQ